MNFTTDLKTLDGFPVREGEIYFDYDMDLVRIEVGTLHKDLHVDHGAAPTDAWFDVTKLETGTRKLMNGPRLWRLDPNGRRASVMAEQRGFAVLMTRIPNCDAHKMDQNVEIPAVGDFRTLGGRWGNLCDSHRRELTDGTAGTGHGQYFTQP
jgi:hypothetical protein